ncbi:hypothetical protein [Shewanella sp. GXUN23E]|uniref:hypothetical protein n=1 Tax=Shewanella sp. GXUN23E TaxID=3422498 RepID=UPI003D7DDDD2
MITFLESMAASRGFIALTLEATLNAASFYRRCGYGGEGKEVDAIYHLPRGVDLPCVRMSKTLI